MKSALADFIGREGVAKKSKKKTTAAIVINKDFCKGCGICVAFCPAHILELGEDEKAFVKRLEDCTACGLCEMRCPDIAIEVQTEAEKTVEQGGESRPVISNQ
jgi:2-oxoglutarate ferredoxin oxidoreductase subunit delta